MAQQLWSNAVQISADAVPAALGMAAVSYGLVRAHLETVEAVMLAVVLLLIVLVL